MDGMNRGDSAPVLQIRDLSITYVPKFGSKVPAVRNLSLSVSPGEIHGLVGESGCGKSTVAFAAVNYLPKGAEKSGEVLLNGVDILNMPESGLRDIRGNRIAMVYQDPSTALNPAMTIIDQLAEVITTHRKASNNAARDECYSILEQVRIADPLRVGKQYPHQLSGGMQQRVIIAMAMLLKPAVLIMDEPTTGLDVTIEAAVLDLIVELQKNTNTAILFISHNLGIIAQLCTTVGVMYAGEMVESGSAGDVFSNPAHPYTKGLLACLPSAKANKHTNQLQAIGGRLPQAVAIAEQCIFADRCAFVQPVCKEKSPPSVQIKAGHAARCLFVNQLRSSGENHAEVGTLDYVKKSAAQKTEYPALVVDDLSVHYHVSTNPLLGGFRKSVLKAINGVSFTIQPKSIVGVVGESGCGKSTLAKAVAGISPVTRGKITLGNENLNKLVTKREKTTLQRLQMVFQNPESTLNPHNTVETEIRRPMRLFRPMSAEDENATISMLLKAVNLTDQYRHRYPAQLSGGEKQRVAIARAFAGLPDLVLCDEPTSALDVSVQAQVLNLLVQLQSSLGVSILFISHDLGVVRYIADYIAVIYLGMFCEYGTVEEVFAPPYHPYTESLFSAIPVPDPFHKRQRITLQGRLPSATNPPSGCVFHTRCPRKLGKICEEVQPKAQTNGGHLLYCHIPAEELSSLQADYSLKR